MFLFSWNTLVALVFVPIGFQAGRQTMRDWLRYRTKRRHRSHRAVMARLLRLEMKLGLGIQYAEDWLRSEPPPSECWGCGRSMHVERMTRMMSYARADFGSPPPKRDAQLEERLCARCIAKAHAEIEAL